MRIIGQYCILFNNLLKTNTTKNTFDGRVVSAFRLDESKLIAVMIVF